MHDFTHLIDLAAQALGGKALLTTDEFFAPMENLLKPGRGEFIVGKYTENGKWMDGWESRRKRIPGHDWCIIKLGMPGIIRGIDVDTNHFTGNFPEHASFDGCEAPADVTLDQLRETVKWTELVPLQKLKGGSQNLFAVTNESRFTHVRLHIYPDGGVARLRVHGEVVPDWDNAGTQEGLYNLSALENGAVVVCANDMFFGHMNNLIMPGDAETMGDGWETRRKRGPGNDWLVIRLAAKGIIRRVMLDTMHFRGNYPEGFSLEGAVLPRNTPPEFFASRSIEWHEIAPITRLHPGTFHDFREGLDSESAFTHVRLSIYPDGGIARLRLLGDREGVPRPAVPAPAEEQPNALEKAMEIVAASNAAAATAPAEGAPAAPSANPAPAAPGATGAAAPAKPDPLKEMLAQVAEAAARKNQ